MVLGDEESRGSQHSTSKLKRKNKKMLPVSRKEFLNLQSKVDQIMAAVSSTTPHTTLAPTKQYLLDRIEILDTKEKLTT